MKRRARDLVYRQALLRHWLVLDPEDLKMTDSALGQRIIAYYVLAVAEEHGRLGELDEAFTGAVLKKIPEATKAEHAALEKALIKAAAGEFDTAGRLFRQHFNEQAAKRANASLVQRYVAELANVNASRKAGGRGRAAKFSKRDASVVKDLREMCDQGVAKKDAVGKLAGKYSLSKGTIRKIVGKTREC
jgi:hypothetical protein